MKIYNGYERLARNYALLTDEYEFTMGNGYLLSGKKDNEAIFDVFFRKVPNDGGYAIMAGVDKLIPFIENLKFEERELDYFRRNGYSEEFINYLKNFKFTGTITAIPDGTPVFPNEPLVTIKAPIIEAQIIETCVLSIINGAMEHATGARRIIEATPKDVEVNVMEFGARRADGPEAGIDASTYGMMAGCHGTSNVLVASMLNIKALGTMAHSWIESFATEYEAFLTYAMIYPNNCMLLVDTYDTLRSGIPNAIKVFNYMKKHNMPLDHIGIRIDSGDLAYLSKETRRMLDEAGFTQAKICLSNGLTAETITSLISEGACFDSLGVGDNISKPEGRMGCVYKEVALRQNGIWIPKIKVSNTIEKTINPDHKKLYRAYDKETGYALADIMTRQNEKISTNNLVIVSPVNMLKKSTIENFELVELQKPIFVDGQLVYDDPEIMQKRAYCEAQMATIYPEIKRVMNPHEYYVDGTEAYVTFKNQMIENTKQLVKKM